MRHISSKASLIPLGNTLNINTALNQKELKLRAALTFLSQAASTVLIAVIIRPAINMHSGNK